MGDAATLMCPGWTCYEHEPGAISSWLRERAEIWTEVALPGRGFTRDRWHVLNLLGAGDLSAARIVEGHLDALAIINDLCAPQPGSDRRIGGVWAAQPASVRAVFHDGSWTLHGTKEWCSGAGVIDYAVVTATATDGPRLFEVAEAGFDVLPGTWTPKGMVASASATVGFHSAVHVSPLGEPNAYVDRAGFGHGGVGEAAVSQATDAAAEVKQQASSSS